MRGILGRRSAIGRDGSEIEIDGKPDLGIDLDRLCDVRQRLDYAAAQFGFL